MPQPKLHFSPVNPEEVQEVHRLVSEYRKEQQENPPQESQEQNQQEK